MMNLNTLVATIREGRAVGPRGPLAFDELIVTWKSVLFMGDGVVLKVMRPIDIDGENREGIGARRVIAERERGVGRRLSPLVYLGDASFVGHDDGSIELVTDAMAGEPVIAMRRLPVADRLDVLLSEPGFDARRLDVLMHQLLDFHGAAIMERSTQGHGRRGRALARWQEAVASLEASATAFGEGAPAPTVGYERLAALGAERFATRETIFAQRVAEGRIRNIHGALQLNHIFVPSTGHKARIIDAADGHEDERFIDTAEELAGLALEIGLVRSSAFVESVMGKYAEGAEDRTLEKVLELYAAMVAVKRAGRALREAAAEGPESPARARAEVFLAAAEALIEKVPVEPPKELKRINVP